MITLVIVSEVDECSAEICKDYWRLSHGDDLALQSSEICDKYSISQAALSKILRRSCQVYDESIRCEVCHGPIGLNSRAEWDSLKRKLRRGAARLICAPCKATVEQDRRAALQELVRDHYVDWRSEEASRIARLIEAQYGGCPVYPTTVNALSFVDAVCLLAMFNLYGSDRLDRFRPFIDVMGRLTPTQELDDLVVRHLQSQQLIGVHIDSSPEAFSEGLDGGLVAIERMITWRPLFAKEPTDILAFLERLRDQLTSDNWPDHWKEEASRFCHDVALHECLFMLDELASERSLKVKLGEKARSNLNQILRTSSVGQCIYLVSQCVKRAADYMAKDGVSSWQAANSIANNLIKRYQWSVDRGFELYSWRRGAKNPESELSRVLFSVVMKAGPGWFALPVSGICYDRGLLRPEV